MGNNHCVEYYGVLLNNLHQMNAVKRLYEGTYWFSIQGIDRHFTLCNERIKRNITYFNQFNLNWS